MVDNASTDGSADAVRARFPDVQRHRERRRTSASRAPTTSACARRAAQFVLVLNSDCEVRPGAVAALAAILDARPDVAIVGPRTRRRPTAPPRSRSARRSRPLAEWRQGRLVRGVEGRATRTRSARAARARRARAASPTGSPRPASWPGAQRAATPSAASTSPSSSTKRTSTSASASAAPGGRVLYTPRGRGRPSPGPQHGARARARAPRVPPQPPALLRASTTAAAQRVALRAWMAGGRWRWLALARPPARRRSARDPRAVADLAAARGR